MIELYGMRIEELPTVEESLALSSWATVWRSRHPRFSQTDAARAGLGGLLLLEVAGLRGNLRYTEKGRPYLEGQAVDFNLTHTKTLVLCAIGRPESNVACRVGLDAEDLCSDRMLDPCAMAKRWFSPAEQELFIQDPTTERFLKIWTKKEAYVKWTGEGLGGLRSADTTAPREVAFWEYEVEGAAVALCAPPCHLPPREITMLTGQELCRRLREIEGENRC